ncbi:hypothetical protein GIB67_004920 [Kingdonia uniflora]|uniref:Uncharacterized protein n=1 Tax=Kingdonia uniflora TaxID=39325 RepID=A0A7J7M9U8_9MAGN|nr:hypothetical protein GIB67_004920 [Kingdonia uniflora]
MQPPSSMSSNDYYHFYRNTHAHHHEAVLFKSPNPNQIQQLGLLDKWCNFGLKWVLLFQDSNGLLFKAIPASLGVSSEKQYDVNSLVVSCKAKEAIGEITKLTHTDGRTVQLDMPMEMLTVKQDYPKTLSLSARADFTVMDTWLAYAPVKNNPEDVAKEVEVWPRIVWEPKWALTFADVKEKVHGHCSISQRSTLVIKGHNVAIEDLTLDGALIISSAEGVEDAKVTTVRGKVQNKGFIKVDNGKTSEIVRIRGFRIKDIEKKEVIYSKPENFYFES